MTTIEKAEKIYDKYSNKALKRLPAIQKVIDKYEEWLDLKYELEEEIVPLLDDQNLFNFAEGQRETVQLEMFDIERELIQLLLDCENNN